MIAFFVCVVCRNLKCTCTIIDTAQWTKQSLFLKDMVSRLGMTSVPCISTMATIENEVVCTCILSSKIYIYILNYFLFLFTSESGKYKKEKKP